MYHVPRATPQRTAFCFSTSGMTLAEVMIALMIISLFAMSAMALMLLNQKRLLTNFYRLEAYEVAQNIAEHAMNVAMAGSYTNFTGAGIQANAATGTATAWTWTNTDYSMTRYLPEPGLSNNGFTFPVGQSNVVYNKVIAGQPTIIDDTWLGTPANTIGSNTAYLLPITVQWTFRGRTDLIVVNAAMGKDAIGN